jgi:hypothetical protein
MAIPITDDPYYSKAITIWTSKGKFSQLVNLLAFVAEELEHSPVLFYRPASVEDIVQKTKFTKREVQLIYRSFKQLCPSGVIQKSTFQEIYSNFFPHGNARIYSDMVFKSFDSHSNGFINFEVRMLYIILW